MTWGSRRWIITIFLTEIFSVRTDIPPEVVLCALPGASCRRLLSVCDSQKGTLHFPFGSLCSRTLLLTLCLAKIRRAELRQAQRLPCCHVSIVCWRNDKKKG